MKKTIDCFFIGQNQVDFQEYENFVRKQDTHSGSYRDLHLNTLQYNGKFYSAADIYNLFCCDDPSHTPIKNVETFSAGIAYLGSYLHRRGFSFDFINSFQDEKDYLQEKLLQDNIMTIAILTTFYITADPIAEVINFIRKYDKKVKIIVGGPFIATIIRSFQAPVLNYMFTYLGADFYVNSSQGEATLVNIITALKNNLPLQKINNIYYKAGRVYVSNPMVREENNLSENMVTWDLFSARAGQFVNVRTAVSCPFSCSFCAFPQHAGRHQTAGIEAVENELKQLAKITSLRAVIFIDDTFNIPEKRFKELLRMMIKNRYSFKWASFLRCQYADRETIELMKDAGCELVLLGLESGNPQILKNMNKSTNIEKYYEGLALLKENGIITMGNFIIGFPGETEETVQDTVEFIKKSGLDFYRAQLWYYDHITPIAAEKDKYMMKGESFDWSHKTMNAQQACDLIEKVIFAVDDPVRYPEYYFDFDNVWQLKHKGITFHQVKKYLKSFNHGIREKLQDPGKEVSPEIIRQFKESCQSAE